MGGSSSSHREIFEQIDVGVQRIHRFAVEPLFSLDVQRRSASCSSDVPDEYILKRMIELIAFSQQSRASVIEEMVDNGVFASVFASYSPAEVARLNPENVKKEFWCTHPHVRLSPLRFPHKIDSMIGCANSLAAISARHGSFIEFIYNQKFPARADSQSGQEAFWDAFARTQDELVAVQCPFFSEFTSLCHLLQVLGHDCAKPDSVIMAVASRLGVIPPTTRRAQRPLKERKSVVRFMQKYAAYKGVTTGVVDLYFLILGRQSAAVKFVDAEFYNV